MSSTSEVTQAPIGGLKRTRFKGIARTQQASCFVATAYNLVRLANLAVAAA